MLEWYLNKTRDWWTSFISGEGEWLISCVQEKEAQEFEYNNINMACI